LDNGLTDVWTLDFRMSNRYSYNLRRHDYNLDDIALFDYPAAIAKMRESIGNRRIHVICHCLGAVSFMMSLFGKAVNNITSVIANSAALTLHVPQWTYMKTIIAPFFVDIVYGFSYINPRWSEDRGFTFGKLIAKITSLGHPECDVPACHMLSLMWGSGNPALYHHENLHEITHRRGGDLYGGTSMSYHWHLKKIFKGGGDIIKYRPDDPKYDRLPNNYFEYAQEIETPVLFMTGEDNQVFSDSNILCHEKLNTLVPNRHELQIFPHYGHQDVFMGKNNHIDIFPRLLEFLNKHRK